MARQLKLEISETVEYLEKSLKQARTASAKERLPMLWWLKTGQVHQHQQLSHRLGRSPATMTRWLSRYRQGGLQRLLTVQSGPGAVPKIQGDGLEQLKARRQSEEGFGSDGEIVSWLAPACQVAVQYNPLNRFVRQQLKAELKGRRPVSLKQAPQAIETFKKTLVLP